MKTLLLENDNFMWKGLQEFCDSFDKDWHKVDTDTKKDFMISQSYSFVGLLSQPFVERCITASSLESKLYLPNSLEPIYQLEHFVNLFMSIVRLRRKLGYKPLIIEVNYHGENFIEDIKRDKWGWDCSATLKTLIRQQPNDLIVNWYKEYKFQERLTEQNLY